MAVTLARRYNELVMELFDTHCHIQFADYALDPDEVIRHANQVDVSHLMVVGCDLDSSRRAVTFASQREKVWASIGLHPHEATNYVHDLKALDEFSGLVSKPQVVAIGETGLDYYYNHSSYDDQRALLSFQLDLAIEHDLPLIFHIRDGIKSQTSAFSDFWQIFDEKNQKNKPLRGVVHSFSSHTHDLEQALSRGLYIGLNGIMTFTNRQNQLESAKKVPLDRLVLETDAPFLTPAPFRGRIGEPKYVRTTAEFLANLRGESLKDLAQATTANAKKLFSL